MKKTNLLLISVILFLLLVLQVSALASTDENERSDRLDFGHVLNVKSVTMDPPFIPQGGSANLTLLLENNANFIIKDVRIDIDLPSQIAFNNDISQKKIVKMESGEMRIVYYNVIALPSAIEGIYESELTINYLNNMGTERQDNSTFSIMIKSTPNIVVKIDKSEVYKGSNVGEVTIKFINNGLANIKLLTVKLLESEDFEIIESNVNYIGDLDSDDFETVGFRIKEISGNSQINLPLEIQYKDALNNNYLETINVPLKLEKASDLGLGNGNSTIIWIIIFIIIIAAWIFYKRYKNKHHKKRLFQ
ncbi:MAG: hypothetical protein KKF56_00135 [Nanoarchaeota archaeon]|nr:hypothetical protein [Nanoarchaeota archaeon]